MPFQTVTCEVRWVAKIGYSGTELPPSRYEVIGEFETEGDAARALAEAGLTRYPYGWRGRYSYGTIQRVLNETGYSKSDFKVLRAENERLRAALEKIASAPYPDTRFNGRGMLPDFDGFKPIARAALGEEKK